MVRTQDGSSIHQVLGLVMNKEKDNPEEVEETSEVPPVKEYEDRF
jgi:hypothetical protein